jgi:hypothetical protein
MESLQISFDIGFPQVLNYEGMKITDCCDWKRTRLKMPFPTKNFTSMKLGPHFGNRCGEEETIKFIHRFTRIVDLNFNGLMFGSFYECFLTKVPYILAPSVVLRSITILKVHACNCCLLKKGKGESKCRHNFLYALVKSLESISCNFLSFYVSEFDFQSVQLLTEELSPLMKNYWIKIVNGAN